VFADRFGRPGKGNDKGKAEGLIGWVRRNLLVPVPRASSLAALNEQLLEGCRRRLVDRLRGHQETIGERLVRDLAAFHDLPPTSYDGAWLGKATHATHAREAAETLASCLVRGNSVPGREGCEN
jgi:hypothetical protein